ncbi:MAG TPA: ABC transporter permease [Pararhizobium sp.]|nr:ABC transporter permease [Pararhizobium sp.]
MTDAPDTAAEPQAAAAPRRRPGPRLRPTGPIVPASNVSGNALMLVIAIMSFLACLTLGAVTMIRATASNWESQISREITIQIKPREGLDMEAALKKARSIALGFHGTNTAEIMDKAATARLLQPWLGSGLDIDELPVPRLVVVTIDEQAPPDFAAMRAELKKQIPEASLDDHRTWVGRLVAMAQTTVLIGIGVLGLVFTATILTVVFATRGALSGNRHIVEVLHFVGAESRFVAVEFQRHFFRIGLKGACAGGILAAAAFAFAGLWQHMEMATPGSDQTNALFGRFQIGFGGYFGIAVIIAIVAGMTALTTRITVVRTIHEIDMTRADASRGDTL